MKRKSILTFLVLLVLFAFVGCASVSTEEKVDVKNMTDEQVLELMQSRGFNIYAPRFRVIYNDRLIYGPNFQEDYMPDLEETLAEAQTVELVDESPETSEQNTEEAVAEEPIAEEFIEVPVSELVDETFPEEIVEEIIFNEPLEYNIPDYAFVSEDFGEEFDILAQWEAYLAEEESYVEPVKEATEDFIVEPIADVAETTETPTEATEHTIETPETDVETEVFAENTDPVVEDGTVETVATEEKQGAVITLYEEQERVVEPFIPSPYPITPEQVETKTLAEVEENIGVYTPLDWVMYVVFPVGSALVCLICAIVKKTQQEKKE